MKRIDTINARENMFGVGKSGFHDNADLPGQDATYVSPEWFNAVQEELCNLLELRGIALNPASKRQLYDLLTTQADLEALATEIESNFIRKSQIIDNLTTNDATKPVSAAQAKNLQDNKLDKSALNNTLTSASKTEAVTASMAKKLNDEKAAISLFYSSLGVNAGYQKIAGGFIIQWGYIASINIDKFTVTFPIAFPNQCAFAAVDIYDGAIDDYIRAVPTQTTTGMSGILAGEGNAPVKWFAMGF